MSEKNLPVKAEKGNSLVQLVTFKLENEEYGVEVLKVREIIRMPEITKMPNTPHYVEGIINLRGKVIPIISMRTRFDLSNIPYDLHTRIMVMDLSSGLNGFIVDSVSEVIRVPEQDINDPPMITTNQAGQECIVGVLNRFNNDLLVMLDLEKMFSQDELLNFQSQ